MKARNKRRAGWRGLLMFGGFTILGYITIQAFKVMREILNSLYLSTPIQYVISIQQTLMPIFAQLFVYTMVGLITTMAIMGVWEQYGPKNTKKGINKYQRAITGG